MKQKKRGNKRRQDKFNPNRAYIDQAVNDYLKKGNKIKKIEIMPDFIDSGDNYADHFLMGWL